MQWPIICAQCTLIASCEFLACLSHPKKHRLLFIHTVNKMTKIPPQIHKQLIAYILPLFLVTTCYGNRTYRPRCLFFASLSAAIPSRIRSSRCCLIISTLTLPLSLLYPCLFFPSYGFIAAQAYNTRILVSDYRHLLDTTIFRAEILGLFVSQCVTIPLPILLVLMLLAIVVAFMADPPSCQAADPYQQVKILVLGAEEAALLAQTHRIAEPSNSLTRRTVRSLSNYKILCAEYKAMLRCDPPCWRFQFGIFYTMLLFSQSKITLLIFSLLNPLRLSWLVLPIISGILLEFPFEWMALFARMDAGGNVAARFFSAFIASVIIKMIKVEL